MKGVIEIDLEFLVSGLLADFTRKQEGNSRVFDVEESIFSNHQGRVLQ